MLTGEQILRPGGSVGVSTELLHSLGWVGMAPGDGMQRESPICSAASCLQTKGSSHKQRWRT